LPGDGNSAWRKKCDPSTKRSFAHHDSRFAQIFPGIKNMAYHVSKTLRRSCISRGESDFKYILHRYIYRERERDIPRYFVGFTKSQGSKRVVLLFSAETPATRKLKKSRLTCSEKRHGGFFSDTGFVRRKFVEPTDPPGK